MRAAAGHVAGGQRQLLVRPPDRGNPAAAACRVPVPRRRRRQRPRRFSASRACRSGSEAQRRRTGDAALDDAARVGLLTSLGGGMYGSIPRCQGYLAAAWRRDDTADHDAVREAAVRALLTAHAILGGWLGQQINSGDAGLAYAVIGLERHTLGSLLGYALGHELWGEAQAIIQPLDGYWGARGLDEEAGIWTDRVRLATEGPDGMPPELDTPAGDLWLYITGSQASRELQRDRLDSAERTYRQILTALQAQQAHPTAATLSPAPTTSWAGLPRSGGSSMTPRLVPQALTIWKT